MAEKTLNTRILLKNADLSAWNSSTLVLKAGEVALAKIETTQHDAATGNYYKVPTYLMKVGDGSKTFSQLNWLAAPASDVHTWAKKAALDYADLPATLQTEIDNLQTAVGTGGTIDSRITAAINALKDACTVADTAAANQFVTAVAQDDGKIAVTRRALTAADIPTLEISKIDGLQGALDAKAAKADFDTLNATVTDSKTGLVKQLADEVAARDAADDQLQDQINTIKTTTVPTLEANIATAQSTADTAKSNAAKAQGEVDALEGTVATLTQTVATNKSNIETALSAETKSRQDADAALQEAIDDLAEAIGNVTNLMNFRGAVTAKTAITDPAEGDVIVVTAGDDKGKEFVYSNGAWVEFGSVDAQQTAIDGLLTRMSSAEGRIKTIEDTYATDADLAAEKKTLQDAINLKADKTTVVSIEESVETLQNKFDTYKQGMSKWADYIEDEALVNLRADVETRATKTELNTAVGTLEDAIDLKADKTTVEGIDGRLTIAEGNINYLGEFSEDLQEWIANTDIESRLKNLETASATHATKADLKTTQDAVDAIEANYVKVSGTNLVTQSGDVIIFDCGGATA